MQKIKYLCKVAVLCIGIAMAGISSTIISNAQETEIQVQPRMLYINNWDTGLSISDSGIATVSGYVEGVSGVSSTSVKLTLQKNVSGSWVAVKSWEKTSSSRTASISESYQVSKGTYRVVMTCRANSETKTVTSGTKTY
ncbi:MAG: hypothetical protein IJ326_12965 [Lachnospiraceae bacterium]|nr:hypothetical protein [Lachnospiraceae bacterium]